ncbi:MAG: HTTM domain-containing protein [Polyangiales bacterium]
MSALTSTSSDVAHRTIVERRLATMRVAIGVLLLVRTTPVLHALGVRFASDSSPLVGWPHEGWTTKLVSVPASVLAFAAVARTVAAIGFLLGVSVGPCGVAVALLGWLGMASDTLGWINSLHLLYVTTLLLATTGCDRALTISRPPPWSDDPTSGLWLMRALLLSLYAWTGIAKLNRAWLGGDTLELFIADGSLRGPLFQWLHAQPHARVAFAWTVMVFELSIGPALLARRTRRIAIAAAITFHALVELTVRPDVFGWICVVLAFGFVDEAPRAPVASATPPASDVMARL